MAKYRGELFLDCCDPLWKLCRENNPVKAIKVIVGGLLVLVSVLVVGFMLRRPEPGTVNNEIGEVCFFQELGQPWHAQVKTKGCYSYRCTRQIQRTGKLVIDQRNHALHFEASWVLVETSGFPFGCTDDCMGGGTLDFYLDDLEVGDWAVFAGDEKIGNVIVPSGVMIERQCVAPDSISECEGCWAAGICADAVGNIVSVSINPDVPDPRCVQVDGGQRLSVVNHTNDGQKVTIGDINIILEPGEEYLIDQPMSSFLQPCCNYLQSDPGMGGHCIILKP